MSRNAETQTHFKYTQLYEILAEKITTGEWKPNDSLPTERELCQRYHLSRVTVREALDMLVRDGYIYRRQGKGTFVAVRPIEQKLKKLYTLRESIEANGLVPLNTVLSFRQLPAAGKVREALQLEPEETVFELIRCLYASSIPCAVETTYIPAALCPEMTEELVQTNGLYNTLQSFGIVPERAVEHLSTVPASREDALLLNIRPGETAIRIERTTFSASAVFEYTFTTLKSNFFFYTIELN